MREKASGTRLRGRLYRITQIRWVDIPRRTVEALQLPPATDGGRPTHRNAILCFNGDRDRVTLVPGRPGWFRVAFKVELLRAAGVDAGDLIEFSLAPDTASRVPEPPEEMRRAFQSRPELAERWNAHSVALRRQIVRYIEEAKSPDVRTRRSWTFIERLAETGKLTAG